MRNENHKVQDNIDSLPESLGEHPNSSSPIGPKNADQCLDGEGNGLNESAISPTTNIQSHVQVPSISISTTPIVPVQGEQACAHKCKDKKVCRHLCCKEGVRIRVKRRLKTDERDLIMIPPTGSQSCSNATGKAVKAVKVLTNEIKTREHERSAKWMHQYRFQQVDTLNSDPSSETSIPVTPGIQSKEAFHKFITRFLNS